MATRWNNSKLLIVFVILIAVFLLVRYFNNTRTKGNFDPNVINLDTAEITEILLYPQINNQQEIRLFRDNNIWKAQKGALSVNAKKPTVMALIIGIQNIKPTRLAGRTEEKWEKFSVNDSLASKVKIILKNGEEIGLLIGKFSYKQALQKNPYQQQGFQTISYFRVEGQDETYATDDFLTMTFNRDFNAFRDQTFLKTKSENIRKLSFKMPGDSSYYLIKVDSVWMLDSYKTDEAKVKQLISKLGMNNQNQFVDSLKMENDPEYSLVIEGDNMNAIKIESFELDSSNVLMKSSMNEEALFKVAKSGLFNDLFKSPDFYLDSAHISLN